MIGRLFTGAVLGYAALFALAASSYASPSERVTVDVYGSSYSVELEHEATDQVLKNQPWWGNKVLANELCEALVYEGDDIASVGYNIMEIGGQDYIEAYLVMPLANCSGPVVIAQEDIGQMTGGTFFVLSGSTCFTRTPDNSTENLRAQLHNKHNRHLASQDISALNCGYFNSFNHY